MSGTLCKYSLHKTVIEHDYYLLQTYHMLGSKFGTFCPLLLFILGE